MQVFKYSLTFDTNRSWSSSKLHLSGIIVCETHTEALEKSMLIVDSNYDMIYKKLVDMSAEILYSSSEIEDSDKDEDDEDRWKTVYTPLTDEEVKKKILDKIKVEIAPEFCMQMTGHSE